VAAAAASASEEDNVSDWTVDDEGENDIMVGGRMKGRVYSDEIFHNSHDDLCADCSISQR